MADIDFTRATVSGVASAKADAETAHLKTKLAKQMEQKEMKNAMDPKAERAAAKAEKALKQAYIQDAASKIRSGVGSDDNLTPEQKEQLRVHLCAKLAKYYTLPQFSGRQRIQISDKTSIETLKAEIYDLEQTALNPADLFFGVTVLLGKVIEKMSINPKDESLRFGLDLKGFSDNLLANKQLLDPHIQVLAVKYSTLLPSGPWAGLSLALFQIAHHTHSVNTSKQHYSRPPPNSSDGAIPAGWSAPEEPFDSHSPHSPLSPDVVQELDASIFEHK